MTPDDDTAADAAAQENADFASGFSDEPVKKPAEPEPAAPDKAPATAEVKPEYVQVTAAELAELRAAAAKIPSYDHQLSRLHGTTGNLQKLLNDLRMAAQPTQPSGRKIEIPKEAFADLKNDFPELAQKIEAILAGAQVTGASDVDAESLKETMAAIINEHQSKREVEALQETYPDWQKIVGAVDITKEQPPADNQFRKWLATKDAAYQTRINGTESAAAIQRSITLFRRETRTTPKAAAEKPRDVRADRIRAAVQPRGDGPAATPVNTAEDAFAAGFNSR